MSDKDKGNLLAILDSSAKIKKFVEDHDEADSFYKDIETFDAVLLNFVIIAPGCTLLLKKGLHFPQKKVHFDPKFRAICT